MSFQQWSALVKEGFNVTSFVATYFCFLHVTNTYLFTHAWVYGPSMLPTFSVTGNLVLAERVSTRLGKVGRGDVVLIRSPQNPRKVVTKRLVGMEGDKITYVVDPKNSDRRETIVVPKGHVWIEGDNIYATSDSRKFGPVPYGLLHGRVFCKIWPAEDVGFVGKYRMH